MDDLERRVISLEEWRKHMEAIVSIITSHNNKIENRLVSIQDSLGSHIEDESERQSGMYRLLIAATLSALGGLGLLVLQLLSR